MNLKSDAVRLFKALCLFFLPNFPDPTFIPCPMSIPEYRVGRKRHFRNFSDSKVSMYYSLYHNMSLHLLAKKHRQNAAGKI